jgi:hypothetical protein
MLHARRYGILVICILAGCTALSQPGVHLALAQQYDQWCAVKVRETSEWRFVPDPRSHGLRTAGAYAEGLYYQHAEAAMLILCIRQQGTLAESAQYHVSNLAHDYATFNIVGKNDVQFQQAPAIWFLYNGVRKDMQHPQHGYIIISDRGQYNLVIALLANADAQHRYSPAFRSAIDLIRLR